MKTERPEPRATLMMEAADWYWRIREPDVSAETIATWEAWLHAAEEHRYAFSSIERTLQHVDQVRDVPWPGEEELLRDSYDGSVPVREWRGRPAYGLRGMKGRLRTGGPRHRGRAVAASVLLLVALGTITAVFRDRGASVATPDFAIYETRAAEHRDVHLPDGSTVTLGGKSAISTAYTPISRLIILRRGTAYFDVVRDGERAFVVQAGSRRISAVGTAFNVTHQVDRIVVTVTEGTVVVTPATKATSGRQGRTGADYAGIARLEAGHQLAYNEHRVAPVTIANAADAIAWRQGTLKYRGELLRYVVDDVNRYSTRPITIADDAAGRMSYTGTVFEQSIDTWLSGLEQVFPVVVEETPDGVFIRYEADKGLSGKCDDRISDC